MSKAIVQQAAGALNAEHYQTFEMAKANDGILGSDDIAQIRSYAAFARAQAQAIHKSIATMGELDDVAQAKAEMTETSQTFAKVSVYADQRIGEILRELPTKQGLRTDTTSVRMDTEVTKSEAIKNAGIAHPQAVDLQKMAANPEVVEAVISKAESEGRIVSRSQVLKAIKERDEAKQKLAESYGKNLELGSQIASLKRQVAEKPEPQVIEREVEVVREVVPEDYESIKRENERLNREYQDMWRKKRDADQRLAQANELLGERERTDNATRDIEHLTIATNTYLRNYGGKAWAFDRFDRVDASTQSEFTKAITNLAAFAQNMVELVNDKAKENN